VHADRDATVKMNPLDLALRFVLELAALVGLGAWGWQLAGYAGAVALPLVGAAAWGTFNVPGDPSRSGRAPVRVPGVARLLLELGFFAGGVYGTRAAGQPRLARAFAALVVAHHAFSFRRVVWLVRQ
jgi:hypothetical protein